MRKLATIILSIALVFSMAVPAFADNGKQIDPSKAFDKEYLTKTFEFEGKEYPDIPVVYKALGNYYVLYIYEDYYMNGLFNDSDSDFAEVFKESFRKEPLRDQDVLALTGRVILWDYPHFDIISINGEPWQLTKYKEGIIESLKYLKPGDKLYDEESEYRKYFLDPRRNGTADVYFSDGAFKDDISMYNPLNNGKPIEISDSRDMSGKDDTKKFVEVPNPPDDLKNGIVMQLNSPIVSVVKDGTAKVNTLSVVPEAPDGYTLIPLRGVIDEMGAKLEYNGENGTVAITMGNKKIVLTIGSNKAVVDGGEVTIEQPAVVKDGRTLVPLRFVGEQLGFKVDFNDGKITISEP